MRFAFKTLLPAVALAFGLGMANAEAAPAGAGLTPVKTAAQAGSAVEQARFVRKCTRVGWRGRRVVCRLVWIPNRRHYSRGHVHPSRRHVERTRPGQYRHYR